MQHRFSRVCSVLLATMAAAWAGGIAGSKHDLSTSSGVLANQVCAYCHTPHHANDSLQGLNAPLWNRFVERTKVFTVYSSATMTGIAGDPNQTRSLLCLGCHDGTIASSASANGLTGNDKHGLINSPSFGQGGGTGSCIRCHQDLHQIPGTGAWKLGLDLSNDHPIAVAYPTNQGLRFRTPPDPVNGWSDARLYNGKVECSTCHLVHDPAIPPFLRKSNAGSALCLTCHFK